MTSRLNLRSKPIGPQMDPTHHPRKITKNQLKSQGTSAKRGQSLFPRPQLSGKSDPPGLDTSYVPIFSGHGHICAHKSPLYSFVRHEPYISPGSLLTALWPIGPDPDPLRMECTLSEVPGNSETVERVETTLEIHLRTGPIAYSSDMSKGTGH